MDKIYLDYAAATPVDHRVLEAMVPYFYERFGNPGSLHSFGQEALSAIDKSRDKLAKTLGVNFRDIIFTSSATEANNLAIRGVVKKSGLENPRIITSVIEHESVLDTCRELEEEGVEVVYLPVSREGFVNLSDFSKWLNKDTALVSVIYASNEIGTIQPIREIGERIKKLRDANGGSYPLFHTDAVQVVQFLDVKPNDLMVDLMTLSSQKIYGPKGAALLYAREKDFLSPEITGGGQEFGLRSGTENVPAIVGFAKAAELIELDKEKEARRIEELRDYFWKTLKENKPEVELNGSLEKRLPNNLNIYFPGHEAEELIIKLDLAGVAVSSGSACSSRNPEPSYVVSSLGLGESRASQSLRITLGRPVTKEEIDKSLKQIINVLL